MAINVSATKSINIWYNASSGGTAGITSITGADKNNLRFNANMANFANNCRNLNLNLQSIPVNAWNNVTDMSNAYAYCYHITGSPVCLNNVTNMFGTYYHCSNLTGSPACGPNVTVMIGAYRDCTNLTGSPVCGDKVVNMVGAYWNCPNLSGSMFMKSNNVNLTTNLFYLHNANKRIDIWTYAGTTTNSALYTNKVGCGAWTLDTTNSRYYNATNNIYVYYNWDGTEYIDLNIFLLNDSATSLTFNDLLESGTNVSAVSGKTINLVNTASAKITGMPISRIRFNASSSSFAADCCNLVFNLQSTPKSVYDNIDYMDYAFRNCYNITGTPVCGDNTHSMNFTYCNCNNIWGNAACGPNVITLRDAYNGCSKLNGSPACGESVTWMANAYYNCYNLTGAPVFNIGCQNVSYAYYNCQELYGNAYINRSEDYFNIDNCISTVYNFTGVFASIPDTQRINLCLPPNSIVYRGISTSNALFTNLKATGELTWTAGDNCIYNSTANIYIYNNCENHVNIANSISMHNAYGGCINLTGSPICSDRVIDLSVAYYDCSNLTGSPVCGNNVKNMYYAYRNCLNLTGNPVCGDNVVDMSSAYQNCTNLNGNPVCGDNVNNMANAYVSCSSLTGNPVCGDNVTNMMRTYRECSNLTGTPVCGPNVNYAAYAYYDCPNLAGGNMYWGYNGTNAVNIRAMFYNWNTQNRLNIICKAGSLVNSGIKAVTNTRSIVGAAITWTDDTANSCYYNSTYNIYVYYTG